MRILYVLTSLGIGGAERQTLALARRMADRGHQVRFMALRRLPEEWPAPIASAPLLIDHLDQRKSPLSAARGLLQARRCVRAFRPDVVHSHGFHANIFARLLRTIAPVPILISTVHNVYEGGRIRMLAYRLTDRLSTRTTLVSEPAATRFLRLKAISPQRSIVLRNAIELPEFNPDPLRRAAIRQTMNAEDSFIWLAAGRIVPAKDYPNLLRAFALVLRQFPQSQLWIAGEDREGNQASLQALARELCIENAIRWLGLRRDLAALFNAADAFVLSSAWEGMPLSLAEAMAMARPVVATNVGGVAELLGDTGALVPPNNSEALAAAMIDLMRQLPQAGETAGHAARDHIAGHFNMETRSAEWEQLYQTLLASYRRPPGRL